MREYKVKKINHRVYENLDEVPTDIQVQHDWRLGRIDDWVLADDGCIIQVLRHGSLTKPEGKNRTQYYIGTCTGTYLVSPRIKMDTSKRDNIYSFGGDVSRNERVQIRKHLTRNERMFALYMAMGMKLQDAYVQSFPTDNKRYANVRAGELIKTERVQTAMKEELKPVLKELGIDDRSVLQGIKDSAESAEKEDVRLRALFKLSDILDLEDKSQTKVTQVTGALFQGFTPEALEEVKRPKLTEGEE